MSISIKGTSKSLNTPEEHLTTKGGVQFDIVKIGDMKVKRATYPVGWRFSTDVGAPFCNDTHVGYVISGSLVAKLESGEQIELHPGSVFVIPAGHDAYVTGTEPFVMVQFDEGESAARRFNVESRVAVA
jgi:mannose-6-phosphate isomerase-like protein (cupin superfamily)